MRKISANQIAFLLLISGLCFIVSGFFLSTNFYKNKIYPNTSVDSIDISGLTISEAIKKLNSENKKIEPHRLKIFVDDIESSSSSADLNAFRSYSQAVNTIYIDTRNKSKTQSMFSLAKSFFKRNNASAQIWYKEENINELITSLQKNIFTKGEDPSISLKISGNENSIVVFKGEPGRAINITDTKENIKNKINNNVFSINATVASTSAVLSDSQLELEISKAKNLVGERLKIKAENKRYELTDKELVSLIQPLGDYKEEEIDKLIEKWSDEVDRKPQNANFDYNEETLEVELFKPHRDGLEINKSATKKMIISWLKNTKKDDQTLNIPLDRTSPEIILESTNNLGIKERIGFGESYYNHSIINRVHNVGITAERISLTVIRPGEEFSFNKTLGEVSSSTGFRPAYVISGGRTVLGDGGGVCQVSSTLFRSILDAGLKISKRLQHSYRVSYYELNSDPGFDATVYAGDIDFRFMNDTNNHILVYSYVESENRYMNIEIYGTDDGRTTEVSNYKKWDFRGPPASEYYPTTDLPSGVTKQIDWSVSGVKTEFTHTIRDSKGSTTSEETYYSNYRPWSAKYMRGI